LILKDNISLLTIYRIPHPHRIKRLHKLHVRLHFTILGHRPYPGFVCVSVNDVIVHGIADENPVTFQEGDLVTVDGGLRYEGLITDMAVTVGAGSLSDEHQNLVHVTQTALKKGIEAVTLGGHVGDIGAAIESFVSSQGFALAEDLAGHGVGYEVHEDPFVPNTGVTGEGAELVSGLVIAIEPMVIVGNSGVVEFSDDGFTVFTAQGAMSAHFEHTVAVTEAGPEVLTLPE